MNQNVTNPIIEAKDLCFSYKNEDGIPLPVIRNLTFSVERGSFVCILGHNGSGKSTLAKLLNLVLTPDSGSLSVGGIDVMRDDLSDDDIYNLRRRIGMVFQNPDNQLVATIVEEDIAFGPENLGIAPDEIRTRVDEALRAVNMTEFAHHSPSQLSGGQKQRIAIAGIIAMLPDCIIFDESTAMLDPLGRKDVMNAIEKLNREKGITVIMITHYMDEAARADRIVVLDDGKLILDGTPSYVFENEAKLVSCGLAIPQCTELVHKMREAGISLNGECVNLEDCADLLERAYRAKGHAN